MKTPRIPFVKTPPDWSHLKEIRVLSLFDGIASGYTALRNLGIPVQMYCASEIDEASIDVGISNYGDKITYIGDIKSITEERIKEILPIHLIIGGSPCNDLSRANPKRRGIFDDEGTGNLVFEFYRILYLVNKHSNGFYWFFENVASMSPSIRDYISKFLQCEPVLIDAFSATPQHRPRLFWGNCPNLKVRFGIPNKPELQEYLEHGRTAQTNELRTMTTSTNSMFQGPNAEYPVKDRLGNPDLLWITEIEKLHGFRPHYTDTGRLSTTARRKVLGRAWHVSVIEHILKFFPDILSRGASNNQNEAIRNPAQVACEETSRSFTRTSNSTDESIESSEAGNDMEIVQPECSLTAMSESNNLDEGIRDPELDHAAQEQFSATVVNPHFACEEPSRSSRRSSIVIDESMEPLVVDDDVEMVQPECSLTNMRQNDCQIPSTTAVPAVTNGVALKSQTVQEVVDPISTLKWHKPREAAIKAANKISALSKAKYKTRVKRSSFRH